MDPASLPRSSANDLPGSFRLTPRGRLRAGAPAHSAAHGALSAHLHDLLQMCSADIGFEQLRQFMPPRTLRESLETLMALGLLEGVEQGAAQLAAA
ncbi:MAG: hypothetical protein AB7P37_08640 [Ramlibacter sp.]